MKKCPKCGICKELTDFVRNRSRKSGYDTYCKECNNARVKARWYADLERNRERQSERLRAYKERWVEYFEELGWNPACQVCGRKLVWSSNSPYDSVAFDHRSGIKRILKPSNFLRQKAPSDKNKSIWLSEDFGILCHKHNRSIPTDPELRRKIKEYL